MRKHLPEILSRMSIQFRVSTGFFYMGQSEVRNRGNPELITRSAITILEWLSLVSKLEGVSPEAMTQLDKLCGSFAESDKRMNL